jgi:PAS domain S-box-containing protein
MKISKKNRSRPLFLLLLAGTFSFILVSVILVYKITVARSFVENHVAGLKVATKMDMEIFSLYSSIDDLGDVALRERVKTLTANDVSNSALTSVTALIANLEMTVVKNAKPIDKPALRANLITIKETLFQLVTRGRDELSDTYKQLSLYWRYTYILVAIACALSILLSISGLLIVRSRNQLMEIKRSNKLLLNNSIDCIIVCDNEGRIQEFNKEAERIFGYRYSEVKNKNVRMLYSEVDDLKKVNRELADTRGFTGEVLNRHKNGTVFTSYLSANALYDEKRKRTGSMGISRDITLQKKQENDRKAVDRQLKKSEVDFRQIAETISDVFYLYNITDKKYEFISPNCLQILGADPDFFYSGQSHTAKFVHPEDKAKLLEANVQVDSGAPYEIEYRLIIDDKIRWINEKSFPIRDAAGMVTRNSGICRDVTNINAALETIHNQNLEIGKSIVYAKTIQDSSLPTSTEIAELFAEFFVFYSPKDMLSGDFYVFESLKTRNQEPVTAFMVGDCTGHGVPGGILSLLCTSLIKESFSVIDPRLPSETLDFVRQKIVKFFRSNQLRHTQDGMDIAICVLNKKENKLYFSGANAFVIIISNNELTQHSGDKQHVGYSMKQRPFTNHEIDVKNGDCVYMFTDGYADQFGGTFDKRFSRKKIKNLLLSVHHLPMDEQYIIMKNEFYEWKGDSEQTDDVAMIGVRI